MIIKAYFQRCWYGEMGSDLTFWYTGEKGSHRDCSAIALFFRHVHWLPDSSTAFLSSFCLVKMALLSPFFVAYTEGKKKEKQQQWDVAFWSIWRLCGEKNGKLWLCKHMEKNELLMHLVSFIYILPSVPNGLPALWTPDDTAALCQGVFLEAELDYANISEWQIKMVN